MKHQSVDVDAVLEPELRELCGELSAIERAQAAEKFLRWADQLTLSAMQMGIVLPVKPEKVSRGFVAVNLSAWQQSELRKMARRCGWSLRGVLRWGVLSAMGMLEDHLRVAKLANVSPKFCSGFIEGNTMN